MRRSCGESISLPRQRRAAYYYCPCTSRESPDRFFFIFSYLVSAVGRFETTVHPCIWWACLGLAWIALVFVNREKRRDSDAVFVVFVTFCNFFFPLFSPTCRLIFALVLLEVLAESKIRSTIIHLSPHSRFCLFVVVWQVLLWESVRCTFNTVPSLKLVLTPPLPPILCICFELQNPTLAVHLFSCFSLRPSFFFSPSFPSFFSHLHARFYRRAGKYWRGFLKVFSNLDGTV